MCERGAIENAIGRWAWCYDEFDLEGFCDCVTEDVRFEVETAGGSLIPLEGRPALRAFFGERLSLRPEGVARRHITTPVRIEIDGDEATAVSYLTLTVVGNGSATLVTTGWYRDSLRKDDGTWRISNRHAYLDMAEMPMP